MSTVSLTTAEQLLRISAEASMRGERCELVDGEVRFMSPGGWLHGDVIGALHSELGIFVRQNKLGKVFGAETGFVLSRNPDTVRAPDIAFVSQANIPSDLPDAGYWPAAPDLAVEVISTNDRAGDIDAKIETWLDSGVQVVWVVDPHLKIVTAYRSRTEVATFTRNDMLEGFELLAGFSLLVSDIFP